MYCGDLLVLTANLSPSLAWQPRINYCWEIIPPDDQHVYGTFTQGECVDTRENTFRADWPGDIQIKYRIEDIQTGYYSLWSTSKTLHLVPKIEITTPNPDDDTATFSATAPGVDGILIIGAGADVIPPEYSSELVWNITLLDGSTMQIIPGQSPDTVDFEFTGLPEKNKEFTKLKYVYASIPQWNVKDSAQVKTFYPLYFNLFFAYNHRGGNPSDPNWFHYWKQTGAGVSLPQSYDANCLDDNGYYDPGANEFHICAGAMDESFSDCLGRMVNGIDNFAVTERHEGQHYIDYAQTFWPNGHNQSDDLDPRDPQADPDWPMIGDYIPDNLEGSPPRYGDFRSDAQDSDGNGILDFDELGYEAECSWKIGDADDEDWGNPGRIYENE